VTNVRRNRFPGSALFVAFFLVAPRLTAAEPQMPARAFTVDDVENWRGDLLDLLRALDAPAIRGAAFAAAALKQRDHVTNDGYCNGTKRDAPQVSEDCGGARLRLRPDGTLLWSEKGTKGQDTEPATLCLEGDWGTRIVVRVRTARQTDAEASCFAAKRGVTYRVLDSSAPAAKEPVALLSVYAALPDAAWAPVRKASLDRGTDVARQAFEAFLYDRWREWVEGANPPGAEVTADAVKKWPKEFGSRALQNVTALALRDDLTKQLAEVIDKNVVPRLDALLPRIDGAKTTVASLVKSYRAAATASLGSVTQLVVRTDPGDEATKIAVDDVMFAHQPAATPGMPPLAFNGEVPAGSQGIARVIDVAAASGRDTLQAPVAAQSRVLAFAHDLVRDETGKDDAGKETKTTVGDRPVILAGKTVEKKASPIAEMVAQLIAVAAKAASVTLEAGEKEMTQEGQRAADRLKKSIIEHSIARVAAGTLANETPPTRTSRTVISERLDADREYHVRICRGIDPCDDKATDAQIAAERTFTTRGTHAIVGVIAELAYSIGGGPTGGFAFERVGGLTGADALYRLESRDRLEDRATFSTLLVIYPPYFDSERTAASLLPGFAVGPSVVQGTSASLFKQWNFRLVFEPRFARGVLVTGGLSVRQVGVPRYFDVGSIVAVPRSDPAPDIARRDETLYLWSVGVGVDLNLVTDAIGKLFKSTGDKAGTASVGSSSQTGGGSSSETTKSETKA
jgi:hypothetical protein